MATDPVLAELAAALPDLPRWVAPRGLLLDGRCEVLFGPEGRKGAGYVVLEREGGEAFAVHRPVASLAAQLAAREPRVRSVVAPVENAESWRALLGGWREQPAVLHVHPAPETLPEPAWPTRFLTLDDLAALGEVPDALGQELARALQRGPVAAAFEGPRAVSFSHAAYRTERWFDLSIDTLESHRRRGFATAAAAFLVRHMLPQGRRPVWGALDADVASIALARKYGFRAVDRLMVFVAGA
ncbi:MAG TPA: GNAT family N-acetyltransferase [Planctomycetota bacterium]